MLSISADKLRLFFLPCIKKTSIQKNSNKYASSFCQKFLFIIVYLARGLSYVISVDRHLQDDGQLSLEIERR